MYIGIDLGTTYSVGAYIDGDGNPQAIPNSESEMITPSVVYIEDPQSIVVGQPAKDNSCLHPENVISLVKNSMGKKNPDGSPIIFHTEFGDYTPEVISGFILKKIVSDATKYLNPSEPIKDVVVTKPAYFTEEQVKATENAIEIAGLRCLGLLNEPTAAALYYAHKSGLKDANILVYDLGGGTFDVTIIHISNGNVEVKATDGLNKVGGSYFDKEMVQNICADFEKETGIDLNDKAYSDVLQELTNKVEKAKIQLSTSQKTTIVVRAGSASKTYELTRADFEEIVAKLYRKTEIKINKVLKDTCMTAADLDKIILAGGSSRIPYVVEHLRNFFGKEPSNEVNPNEVVGLGAALYGKQLTGASQTTIVDVCSHGMGLKALDPKSMEEFNDILIKKNTKLPATEKRAYLTTENNQESLYINVLEGDYREVCDVATVCEVDVPLPAKLPKNTRVIIRLEMDKAQLLHIFLRIPDAGNMETEVTFDSKSNLTAAQVSEWKKSMEAAVDSIDKKNGLGGLISGLFGGRKGSEAKDAASGNASGSDNGGKSGDDKSAADKSGTDKPADTFRYPEQKGASGGVTGLGGSKDDKERKDKSQAIPKVVNSCMDGIIGFEEVKEALRDYTNLLGMNAKRLAFTKGDSMDKCVVIYGKSGMGMTTAAVRVAETLYKIGAVSSAKRKIVTYDDIVGNDEQGTVKNIGDIFQECMDGVVIIDDFHDFYDDLDQAAGMVAVNFIMKAFTDANEKVTLILDGDGELIKKLFDKRPKFAKIFRNHEIEMMGYTADEYVQILHLIAESRGYVVDDRADTALAKYLKGESKLPDFGYIHTVEELLDEAIKDVANKAMTKRHATNEDYSIIRLENFNINGSAKSLDELLEELNSLTGLASVKAQIQELVDNTKVQIRAKEQGLPINDDDTTLHMIFWGNAGTGKTTVARLVSEIFRELGILQKGHLVEVSRKDLVSEFVGKTAKLVEEKCNEAMGGVLFIDEAYSICRDDNDSFGQEAVDALLKPLEDHKHDFICIMAGYTTDMKEFLRRNQGFERRVPLRINFEDYTLDELMQIFLGMASKKGYILEGRAEEAVKNLIAEKMRDPGFGNAGGVRNVFDSICRTQKSRIAKMSDWGENEQLIIRREDINIPDDEDDAVAQLLAELDAMTGLASVKAEVHSLVAKAKINAIKKKSGIDTDGSGTLHMVFTGNPGTGKTTVARKIGKIYKALGLLTKGDTLEVGRSDLVAGYVGQTAGKVQNVIQNAIGGVLFIDEAYTLNSGDENDFGKEAINALVAAVENYRDNLVVIIAGYTKNMNDFLRVNPGLKSRFPNVIDFEDYSLDEMVQIFDSMMGKYTYDDAVRSKVRAVIQSEAASDPDFGNGRGVRNVMDKVLKRYNSRLDVTIGQGQTLSPEELVTILPEDVPTVAGVESNSVEQLLEELDAMTGLASVKREVHQLVSKARVNAMKRKAGLDVDDGGTLHMVFTGNPGTGKTTVARKIGKIYKALGLLSNGETTEVGRSDLVAGYVGQTAGKVQGVIQKAMGGVLFIDEAYTLNEGGENDFGKEAIHELVAAVENHRDNLVVIIAGYTQNMEDFLRVNPGLKSRFPNVIDFADYSLDEMLEIFDSMMSKYKYDDEVRYKVGELIRAEAAAAPDFGNGRGVRNIKDRIIKNYNERIDSMVVLGLEPTMEDLITILPQDVG